MTFFLPAEFRRNLVVAGNVIAIRVSLPIPPTFVPLIGCVEIIDRGEIGVRGIDLPTTVKFQSPCETKSRRPSLVRQFQSTVEGSCSASRRRLFAALHSRALRPCCPHPDTDSFATTLLSDARTLVVALRRFSNLPDSARVLVEDLM